MGSQQPNKKTSDADPGPHKTPCEVQGESRRGSKKNAASEIRGVRWMYPDPNVPRHGKSRTISPISRGYLWVSYPQESLENPKNTMVVHVRERGTRTVLHGLQKGVILTDLDVPLEVIGSKFSN